MATTPKKKDNAGTEGGGLPLDQAEKVSAVTVTASVEVMGLWYGPGTYQNLSPDVSAALLGSGKADLATS